MSTIDLAMAAIAAILAIGVAYEIRIQGNPIALQRDLEAVDRWTDHAKAWIDRRFDRAKAWIDRRHDEAKTWIERR